MAAGFALAVTLADTSRGAAQTAPSPGEILKRPLSPGAVALMVEHTADAAVQRRLAEAVTHPQGEIRAAAARIVYTAGVRGLEAQLAAALASEIRADPVVEQSRALAVLGGTSHDEAIITAWARVGRAGAWKAAEAYAAIRGAAALAAVPQLRAVDPTEVALRRYLRAARAGAPALGRLVDDALTATDATLLGAALAAGRDLDIEPEESRLVAALGASTPAIRLAAVTHVLSTWDGVRAQPGALRVALASVGPLTTDASDLAARLSLELAHRAGGAPASATPEWNAVLDDPDDRLAWLFRTPSARRLLTGREMRRARQDAFIPPAGRTVDEARPSGTGVRTSIQAIDRYPPGFLSGVLAITGCDVEKARSEAIGAGAGAATLRRDGRVARLTLVDTGLRQEGCLQALRLLLMTHVADAHPPDEGEERVLVVPFDPEYVACREAQTPVPPLTPVDGAAHFAPPQRTRYVNPVYPPSARNARLQGVVVLEAVVGISGCVQDLRVTRSVDPRLDLSALRAVLDWRFNPTAIDGTRVPVMMTVTAQFSR